MRRMVTVLVAGALAGGMAACAPEKVRGPVVDPPTSAAPAVTDQPVDPTMPPVDPTTPPVDPSTEPVSNDPSAGGGTATAGEISEDHWVNVETWARAMADDDWAGMDAMSSPGSHAQAYALHQAMWEEIVTGVDDTWKVRPTSFHSSDRAARTVTFEDDDGTTWQFTNLAVDSSGLVTSWDGGAGPLAESIMAGDAPGTPMGTAELAVYSAYRSGSSFYVIYLTQNDTQNEYVHAGAPTYTQADGTSLSAREGLTYDTIYPGNAVYEIAIFDDALLGGRFEVGYDVSDGTAVTLNVPVQPM